MVNKRKKNQKNYPAKKDTLRLSNNYKMIPDIFEGPLDLLIYLIKKEKISIYDVSITKITDQYLAFLEIMRTLDFNISGQFLTMAATLIYIKSRTLMYLKQLPEEEDLIEQKNDLKDKIRQILIFLSYNQNTYLEKILGGNYEKQNIIVTFLALLELVKTGNIQLNQSVTFGELKISASNNFS